MIEAKLSFNPYAGQGLKIVTLGNAFLTIASA
jgi:hypothetical protein